MKHTYSLLGMTCSGCEAKVTSLLSAIPNVTDVAVSKEDQTATITMDTHIPLSTFQSILPEKYKISTISSTDNIEDKTHWLITYKPVLLIFFYITSITLLIQFQQQSFDLMQWMQHFMAGFFLVFSFFKFLNLKGFTESYVMYDIIARNFPFWGYVYAFIELALGLAYLTNFNPLWTNIITFIVMSISIIGVLQSVLNKKRIQCACLGTVFNLPMSTITIIEDALMIIMSAWMIIILW